MRFHSSSPLGDESLTPIVAALQPLTADLLALYASTKLAHWNVRGPMRAPMHKLFDKVAGDVLGYADDVAERVFMLGELAIGTPRQVVTMTRLPEYPAETVDGLMHCRALVVQFEQAVVLVDSARDVADQNGDPDTYDSLTQVCRGLQKWCAELAAHTQSG
jgi:starvation-inducible DNA-binding protein